MTTTENSPLVIQEAFKHGRPVIYADIGDMAEKVHRSFIRRRGSSSNALDTELYDHFASAWSRQREAVEDRLGISPAVAVVRE